MAQRTGLWLKSSSDTRSFPRGMKHCLVKRRNPGVISGKSPSSGPDQRKAFVPRLRNDETYSGSGGDSSTDIHYVDGVSKQTFHGTRYCQVRL